jgi:hypothetical protein
VAGGLKQFLGQRVSQLKHLVARPLRHGWQQQTRRVRARPPSTLPQPLLHGRRVPSGDLDSQNPGFSPFSPCQRHRLSRGSTRTTQSRAIPLAAPSHCRPLAAPRGPSPVDTPPPATIVSAQSRLSSPVHLNGIDAVPSRRALSP